MVRENEQAASFCLVPEMFDTEIGRKQLSSKGAVTLPGRLQGFREKGELSSIVTFSLVEDGADRCLGGIGHVCMYLLIGKGQSAQKDHIGAKIE